MVDADRATAWAKGNGETKLGRLKGHALFIIHQALPQAFDTHLSIVQMVLLALKVIAILAIACAPLWIDHAEKGQISLRKTIIYMAILSIAMLFIWVQKTLSSRRGEQRDRRRHDTLVALDHVRIISKLEEIISLKPKSADVQKRHNLIEYLLTCIDHKTRTFLGIYKEGYFQVTLMVFQDSQGQRFLIHSRARDSRKVGIAVDAKESAAFYVACENRGARAVHDLKGDPIFPYSGLSDGGHPPYRSIFLMPIICGQQATQGNTQLCLGVLSIDTEKPYEFWSARTSDLTTQLQPYTRLLSLLLDRSNGMPV